MPSDGLSGQTGLESNENVALETPLDVSRTPGSIALSFAGLLGGLAAAAIVQSFFPFFEVPAELLPVGTPSAEQLAIADRAQFRVDCLNGAVAGAIYGAFAGLLIGFVATRRSISTGRAIGSGLLVAFAAAVAGTLAGYLMPYVRVALGTATVDTDLWFTIAVQAFFLGAVGLVLGVALAALSQQRGEALQRIVGGLIGGMIAGAVYPIAAAFLFTAAHTEGAVPREAALQFIWLGAGGLLTGLGMAGSSPRRDASTVKATAPSQMPA